MGKETKSTLIGLCIVASMCSVVFGIFIASSHYNDKKDTDRHLKFYSESNKLPSKFCVDACMDTKVNVFKHSKILGSSSVGATSSNETFTKAKEHCKELVEGFVCRGNTWYFSSGCKYFDGYGICLK